MGALGISSLSMIFSSSPFLLCIFSFVHFHLSLWYFTWIFTLNVHSCFTLSFHFCSHLASFHSRWSSPLHLFFCAPFLSFTFTLLVCIFVHLTFTLIFHFCYVLLLFFTFLHLLFPTHCLPFHFHILLYFDILSLILFHFLSSSHLCTCSLILKLSSI